MNTCLTFESFFDLSNNHFLASVLLFAPKERLFLKDTTYRQKQDQMNFDIILAQERLKYLKLILFNYFLSTTYVADKYIQT